MAPARQYHESLILCEIEANKDKYIHFLQRLVRAASPSPPRDTRAAADVVTKFLSANNIYADIVAPMAHMPNVVSDFEGRLQDGPRVVFNGHMDTFPVNNLEGWKIPPYSGHNDGTSIHGLGSVDMKAGTAASIIAFTLLKKRASHLIGSVALTVVSDEETGGEWGTKYLLDHCGENSPWLGDCVVNGEPGGLQSIRFGEKGTLRLTFTVNTQGGNGAYTHNGCGAIVHACSLITTLKCVVESIPVKIPHQLRAYLRSKQAHAVTDEIMGAGAAANMFSPTLNIGTINGGVKVNVIPSKCVFEADIRLPIGLGAEAVLVEIDDLLLSFPGVSYYVQEAASNPASLSEYNHPLSGYMADVARDVTGREPVQIVGLGGTDCKFYRYRGVPAFVFGPSPSGMGAACEAVLIEEFMTVIKTHTLGVFRYLWDDKRWDLSRGLGENTPSGERRALEIRTRK
ncbi:hypothetical protein J4E81_003522 [Alternaria sp. BMP 2799]|nr:hypothetical protein J4E81_003522 [Alternaria sp. BMP 2799]